MYKIQFGFYNSEKAAKKRSKCIHTQNKAVFIVPDGENLEKFAKSIDADPSHLEQLTSEEIKIIQNHLKQQKPISSAQTQPKVETTKCSMTEFKVSFKAPKIDLSNDDAVENSIRALKATKDMKLMSEQQLIYASLIESDCMHLFAVLTAEQRTTVAEFCNYLLQAYGSSINYYSRFEKMQQKKDENYEHFLARVKQHYAGLSGKSIVNFDQNDKKIVVSKFVEALNDTNITSELTKIFSSLSIDTVAANAKNISTAIKKTQVLEVNAVNNFDRNYRNRSSSRDRHRSSSRDRRYRNRSSSRDRGYRNRSSSRDRKKTVSWSDDICYRCGMTGHFVRQCQASMKTVKAFRSKLDSNHQ